MRIDRKQRPWMIATIALALASTIAFVVYAVRSPDGPRGGSAMGLAFGTAGYALMLYAGMLGARKKVPVWRLGRAQTWMRGHLWLGSLSLLLILFHGGFVAHGALTLVLMALLVIVVASGWVGAAIQHYLPSVMTARVPMETIYEEIPHVRAQLCQEADQLAAAICGPLSDEVVTESQVAITTLAEIEREDRMQFREIYLRTVRPFLKKPDSRNAELSDPRRAVEIFDSFRMLLAQSAHGVLDDLEDLCKEEYQLNRQIHIYRWLHGWLLVHVPLSIALLVLAGVHAVVALRY
jgi:hypothetical protein